MRTVKTLSLAGIAAAAGLLGVSNAQAAIAAGTVALTGTVQAQNSTPVRSGLVPPTADPVLVITAPTVAPTAPWSPPPAPPRRRR